VEPGIILSVVLSLLAHTRHGYRPKNAVLVSNGERRWAPLPVASGAQVEPGLMIYRFTHSMYYANSELLSQEILELSQAARPPLSWFCVDCTAVDDVDFTAAAVLLSLSWILGGRGTRLVLVGVSSDVEAELERSGVTGEKGRVACYASLHDVVEAYRSAPPPSR
jgi:MFS superfamily sulfate permease-like transporter